jgi:Family of unknown function (DUF695)
MQIPTPIETLLNSDRWSVISGNAGEALFVLRYRTPVLRADQVGAFPNLLRCLWAYDPEGQATLPSEKVEIRMRAFEDDLCAAWEGNNVAVLTAVLTLDGARQWVFYTSDVAACGELLNSMPHEQERYPIELDARVDPEWLYLRENVIGGRGEA